MNRDMTNIERAAKAWGPDMPNYVRLLAEAADKLGQRGAGALIDRSSSNVSRILNAKYNAAYDEVEKLVLAAMGADKVHCPVFGSIPFSSCIRNRRRKAVPVNFLQRQFAEACPTCLHNNDVEQTEEDPK